VEVQWSVTYLTSDQVGRGLDVATSADLGASHGTVIIQAGQAKADLKMNVILDDVEEDTEYIWLNLTACAVVNDVQNCTVIYPDVVRVGILDDSTAAFLQANEIEQVPDWVWYLVLDGTLFAMVGVYLWYLRGKNRNMRNQAREQDRDQQVLLGEGLPEDVDANMQSINPMHKPLNDGAFGPDSGFGPQGAPPNDQFINDPAERVNFRSEID